MGSGDTFTYSSTSAEAENGPHARDAEQLANAAKEEGAVVARTAAATGAQIVHEAATQASAVVTEARNEFGEVVSQVKDELKSQLDARGQQVAESLKTLSRQLASLAQGRPQEAGRLGALLDDARLRVESYADSLQRRGPQGVVEDLSAFARRRPAMFLFGAAVGGFAVGRLVRGGATATKERADNERRELVAGRS